MALGVSLLMSRGRIFDFENGSLMSRPGRVAPLHTEDGVAELYTGF